MKEIRKDDWNRLEKCHKQTLIILIDTILLISFRKGRIKLNKKDTEKIRHRIKELIE